MKSGDPNVDLDRPATFFLKVPFPACKGEHVVLMTKENQLHKQALFSPHHDPPRVQYITKEQTP